MSLAYEMLETILHVESSHSQSVASQLEDSKVSIFAFHMAVLNLDEEAP